MKKTDTPWREEKWYDRFYKKKRPQQKRKTKTRNGRDAREQYAQSGKDGRTAYGGSRRSTAAEQDAPRTPAAQSGRRSAPLPAAPNPRSALSARGILYAPPARSGNAAAESGGGNGTDARLNAKSRMFAAGSLPRDAAAALDSLDAIIQDIRPLNRRRLETLPDTIRALSHQLTDERDTRRLGYLNSTETLSAYVRYFYWWNLVQLTRVFAGLPHEAFSLRDGEVCLDIGSGPMTVVTALWLSRPELRGKNLVWYCLDPSLSALSLGENLYLSVASRTPPSDPAAAPHWKIVRVKGTLGTAVRQKASLITCAYMFNELNQKIVKPAPELAGQHVQALLSYASERAAVLIAEPGIPVAAHFVSLARAELLARGFTVCAPCPHGGNCPMNGLHARTGGKTKWCNFAMTTEDAPAALKALSNAAGIAKNRAVISFILATNAKNQPDDRQNGGVCRAAGGAAGGKKAARKETTGAESENAAASGGAGSATARKNGAENRNAAADQRNGAAERRTAGGDPCAASRTEADAAEKGAIRLRVASDPISLPGQRTGFYACCEGELVLAVNRSGQDIKSGDLLTLSLNRDADDLPADPKTGAREISF